MCNRYCVTDERVLSMKKDKYKKNNKSQGTPVNKKGAKINKTQIKTKNKLLKKNK